MAIIATLNPLDKGGNAQAIASIPLNRLLPWDGNVRKTGAADGLDELKASIAAHGVLQSLIVRKTSKGKFAIVAGRRRFLALSSLAESGAIASDAPIPCRVIPGTADATEISLTENVVRAPMHPADQFEAFRTLIDAGSSPADIAARFGIGETAVKQRLKLARVSPVIFEAYRTGALRLEQVQAFAVCDDTAAQEHVFGELSEWNDDPETIRSALTQGEIAAADKRVRFLTLAAYEEAGGIVRRDLFAEGDDGVFILDPVLLDELVSRKLESCVEEVRAEGWKWVEAHPELDYEARSHFRRAYPEALPLSEEAAEEQKRLTEEYNALFDDADEGDEAACERMEAIEARIEEFEDTGNAYTPEALKTAGAIITVDAQGQLDIVRGLIRPEDLPEETAERRPARAKEKPEFSASLVESLTEQRSAAISASLLRQPDIALALVTYHLASAIFHSWGVQSSLQLTPKLIRLRESGKGKEAMDAAREAWSERLPGEPRHLWDWCLAQDREVLLELLAFCAACCVDGVQRGHDRPDSDRLSHATALAAALKLDMGQWFTPTAENYFNRVSRPAILAALVEAKNLPARRSWEKLKKSELAALAEREMAGTAWLPSLLKA